MPTVVAMSESTLLGLQSSIGVALANSLEVHRKEEALVRLRSCRVCLYLFTAEIASRSQFVYTRRRDTEVDLNGRYRLPASLHVLLRRPSQSQHLECFQ